MRGRLRDAHRAHLRDDRRGATARAGRDSGRRGRWRRLRQRIAEVQLEPGDELIERAEDARAKPKALVRHRDVLALGAQAHHVGEHELARHVRVDHEHVGYARRQLGLLVEQPTIE